MPKMILTGIANVFVNPITADEAAVQISSPLSLLHPKKVNLRKNLLKMPF